MDFRAQPARRLNGGRLDHCTGVGADQAINGSQAVIINLEIAFWLSTAVVTFLLGLGVGSCTRWTGDRQ